MAEKPPGRVGRTGRAAIAAALGAALTACPEKSRLGEPPEVAATESADDAAPPDDAADEARQPLSGADRQAVNRQLRIGRAKVREGDAAAALLTFERARSLDPGNARVLSELGYAALLAGDLERSLEASRASIARAVEPRLLAASYYNIGRALEASGERDAAREAYERSLRLRPAEETRSRLMALGGIAAVRPSPPCSAQRSPHDVCACLDGDGQGESVCRAEEELGDDLVVWRHAREGDGGEERHFLARRSGDQLEIVSLLAAGSTSTGLERHVEIVDVDRRQVDGRTVVAVDVVTTRKEVRGEMSETFIDRSVTLCAGRRSLRCTLQLPVERSYETEGATSENGDSTEPWRLRLDHRIDADGTVHVTRSAQQGEPPADMDVFVGSHRLW